MDVGTGDGAFAYQLAKSEPHTLVIGVDSNADNLRDLSHKAARKPSKGGLSNVLFGHLALEQAPGELEEIADAISIILPWGSLLKAVAIPELECLKKLRGLCKVDARLNVVFGYSKVADPTMVRDLGLPDLTGDEIYQKLVGGFTQADFRVRATPISVEAIRELPTTWAKKLAFSGKNRTFLKIVGHAL